ncbi:threonine synthase [Sphingomonas sabuli]|uniref:Threonine synthase n=1 Tax=Sphingomonas sabuli TaxID=2764186 RepID=A0A7G9KZE0_9SPHN|nr:threonine synthase [Sphingomonas sabuli]
MNVTHLECSLTGERYNAGRPHNLSAAGKPLLVRYDLDAVARQISRETLAGRAADMWKWRELLPLPEGAEPVSLGEPVTPILDLRETARRAGARSLLVKDEGRLPTGSFKARGLAMAVSMARHFGITRMALPTNGNAGAALAAYGARAGMETLVICPAETPEINVRETAAYGATVWVADGQIDECGRLVREGAAEGRWFDCSTLKEPYRIEGKKVMGLELAEQLGWRLPDAIFYPTGGGTGLIGMWKAFDELEAAGLIGPERPRMYAIQAAGCAPMVRAFEAGEEFAERWEGAATVATGIRVPAAVGDFLILRAVRESGGAAIAVEEEAIVAGVEDVARDDGMLLCPEGGAVVAGWRKALDRGLVGKDEQVLLFNCANGNKYPLPDRSRRLTLASARADQLWRREFSGAGKGKPRRFDPAGFPYFWSEDLKYSFKIAPWAPESSPIAGTKSRFPGMILWKSRWIVARLGGDSNKSRAPRVSRLWPRARSGCESPATISTG